MENCNHAEESNDSTGIVVMADKVVKNLGGITKNIRDRAKAKKAQAISDRGDYLTLTPYQKSLIDVPDYILNEAKSMGVDPLELKNAEPVRDLKYYLPYILGAVVLIALVYFIVKR